MIFNDLTYPKPAIHSFDTLPRGEVRPTIEMATKLAKALEVSLDYLVGNTDTELDKAMLNRVQEINKLSDDNKQHIYVTLDALIRDFKNKQAYL